MAQRAWLIVKQQQVFTDGIPTGEFMPDEYNGVFLTQEEAYNNCVELANTYLRNADYVSELFGKQGIYAEMRVNDEYVFWKGYKIEPVNLYI